MQRIWQPFATLATFCARQVKKLPVRKAYFKAFLHFLLAFSVIFMALTIIMLKVLDASLYDGTDESLRRQSQRPANLIVNMSRMDNQLPLVPKEHVDQKIAGNAPSPSGLVILYDEQGQVLNLFSNIDDTKNKIYESAQLDVKQLNNIVRLSFDDRNASKKLNYRSITVAAHYPDTNIAFLQIMINTDQIDESFANSRHLIILVMASFWLITIAVSIYLSIWSMKPILLAYDKQKNFVSNASHELRTPLAILQNRLELLFQKPGSTIIDESENISASLSEVRNMRVLTSQLLDLAKSEDDKQLAYEPVDQRYFGQLFQGYESLAKRHNRSLDTHIKITQGIQIDKSRTQQLLTILFDNALKYTADSGRIVITVDKNGHYLELTVADNGIGISDSDKAQIFDRFYRVDQARTRSKSGLGLGLSLAKKLADQMQGSIKVTDNQPQGSIFTVKLKLG